MEKVNKGKQREVIDYNNDDVNDNNDTLVDVSLRSFIHDQIDALQTPLSVPAQEELDCTDSEYRAAQKAVKFIKKRRLDKATTQAVIEQIQYLRTSERGKAKIVRLDEHLKLFVDKDDWLEDLPPAWPIPTEVLTVGDGGAEEIDIDKRKLEEYKKLYKATQALRQNRHILLQKAEHYRMVEGLVRRKLKE